MLLKEYPEEYVQTNARNWLKIQQDIVFVKKSLKGRVKGNFGYGCP